MDNEYRFEVYHYGHKIKEFKSTSLNEIKDIALEYLASNNVGVKLFINDKEVPYLDIRKILSINTFSKII